MLTFLCLRPTPVPTVICLQPNVTHLSDTSRKSESSSRGLLSYKSPATGQAATRPGQARLVRGSRVLASPPVMSVMLPRLMHESLGTNESTASQPDRAPRPARNQDGEQQVNRIVKLKIELAKVRAERLF